jgi:hypothetical protein
MNKRWIFGTCGGVPMCSEENILERWEEEEEEEEEEAKLPRASLYTLEQHTFLVLPLPFHLVSIDTTGK